jgi:hypothetical protein
LRLGLVAVCGVALESRPERGERAHFVTESQGVGIARERQLRHDRLPEVVRRYLSGRSIPGDRMQPPLERQVTLLDEPGLRAVE